jgi:tetratricopeptide (TPR) repeat protein
LDEIDIHDKFRQKGQSTLDSQLLLKNRISIKNLRVNNVGKSLLCRTITRCVKLDAILIVVEDPEGNVERLALYNWVKPAIPKIPKEGRLGPPPINQILTLATKLVIKNPSYIIANDGNTMIRSDNPEDVTIIDRNNNELFGGLRWSTDEKASVNEMKKSADDFRICGNNYFASNDYRAALFEYSTGIELEPQNVTLRANRAEVYLRLDQFSKALNDVEIVLKHEPDHLKAAYRKGKALCGLKRYQEAVTTISDLYQRIKVNMDQDMVSIKQSTVQLLKHAKMLVIENKDGQYDYSRIFDEFREKAKIKGNGKDWIHEAGPRLDHADFLNDNIEIRFIEGKGRGWVAKCDIPENTLIMVSKAFKVVYNIEVLLDTLDRLEELMVHICQSLIEEPDHCEEVYKLYGSNLGEPGEL